MRASAAEEVDDVQDSLNVSLQDDELLMEVGLTTTLMIAASESPEPLTREQVDRLLDVRPQAPRQLRSGSTTSGRVGLAALVAPPAEGTERPRSPQAGPLEGRGPGDSVSHGDGAPGDVGRAGLCAYESARAAR